MEEIQTFELVGVRDPAVRNTDRRLVGPGRAEEEEAELRERIDLAAFEVLDQEYWADRQVRDAGHGANGIAKALVPRLADADRVVGEVPAPVDGVEQEDAEIAVTDHRDLRDLVKRVGSFDAGHVAPTLSSRTGLPATGLGCSVDGELGCRVVRPVSDDFLLNMAEVTSTLIGLFLVGVFFYADSLQRGDRVQTISRSYLRSGTRITLIVLAIPLGVSLSLVALEPAWSRALFAALSIVLLAANVDSILHLRGVRSVALVVNELVATAMTVALVTIPWILGGLEPTREDLTWSILLAFAAGLLSITAIVMSVFDVASPGTEIVHAAVPPDPAGGEQDATPDEPPPEREETESDRDR